MFIRVADAPFDDKPPALAHVAPDDSAEERREIPKEQRPTFNLDLVTVGWTATSVTCPSIPGAENLAR
jgi:hypothetical protein